MDNKLFEEKYSTYSDLVFKLSMTYLGNVSDAEDVTQDIFVKLFTNAPQFETPQHERYWIIRVTINACKNYLKTFWNRNTVGMEVLEDMPTTDDNTHTVTEKLYNLPPKYRVVLYLYYYEDYSIGEVAETLGCPQSTVKTRLRRGKARLKVQLEDIERLGETL